MNLSMFNQHCKIDERQMMGTDTRRRSDGRLEVADTHAANERHGCKVDDWCILADGHAGECNEDRELWAGPGVQYPVPA